MSQSNIELNNKMSQIIPKIEYCFGMILLYTVIIFLLLLHSCYLMCSKAVQDTVFNKFLPN